MAKKNETKSTAAPAVLEESTALAPAQSQAIARPSWATSEQVDDAARNMDNNDVTIPRLAIAQALNPQLKRSDPAYIEGLAQLDMFNTVSGENYGTGPLRFTPLVFRKRAIEFIPRAAGGGVVDANV